MHSPDAHHQSPAEVAAQAASRNTVPGGFPGDDFMGAVEEKEADESDSSDEDDIPLASIADKRKSKEIEPVPAPQAVNGTTFSAFDDAFGEKATTPKAEPAQLPAVPDTSAFDDAFADPPGQSASAPVNGASAFDEAMGTLPSKPANGSAAPFSFDNAFEDSFDFGTSGAATGQPAPAAAAPFAPALDGFGGAFTPTPAPSAPATAVPPPTERTFSFDDAFGTNDNAAPAATGEHPDGNDISFDDAFGVTPASPVNNPDTTVSSKASAVSQFQAPPGAPPGSLPNSPMRGSSVASFPTRSASPPSRGASPPPRHQSPRPRASTASSKDGSHEKHDGPAKPEKTSKSRLSVSVPLI
jgi:epidermal growth factor receptor substrate 15